MDISRRSLLKGSAAVGAGLLLPVTGAATASALVPAGVLPFTEPLPTLAQLGVIDATTGTPATLSMVTASHSFHSAMATTPTMAYRASGGTQSYLGPVIIAKQGVPFSLTTANDLGAHPLAAAIDTTHVGGALATDATSPRTSTHLHGGNTPPVFDGDPTATFLPGTAFTYQYTNSHEAGGFWYHDHAIGITRLNVLAGLAGAYLVRNSDDPGDGSTGLPAAPYEVPLIIQDRSFNPDGTFSYPPNQNPGTLGWLWAPEFFGDVAVVNGKAWPNLAVDQGKYRLRLLNGSNARFYNLKFQINGKAITFSQIGSDGGLLNAPVPMTNLLLAPAERADVVVDLAGLAPGTTVVVTNDAPAPYPTGPRAVRRGAMPLAQIMQLTVGAAVGWTAPLPATLRATPIVRYTPAQAVNAANPRSMTLVENLNAQGSPVRVLLNNRAWDTNAANPDNAQVATNTLEQWDIINTTVDAHPIHVHFTQFQVLDRQRFNVAKYVAAAYGPLPVVVGSGAVPPPPVAPYLQGNSSGPAPGEAGWKDTIVAMPGEVTRILAPFGAAIPTVGGGVLQTAFQESHTGEYVWHCHILDHEDNDMMQRFSIV